MYRDQSLLVVGAFVGVVDGRLVIGCFVGSDFVGLLVGCVDFGGGLKVEQNIFLSHGFAWAPKHVPGLLLSHRQVCPQLLMKIEHCPSAHKSDTKVLDKQQNLNK